MRQALKKSVRSQQAEVAEAGAVPDLVALLCAGQADGQYAAAAALYNMAAARPVLHAAVAAAGAIRPLVALLSAESWCGLPTPCFVTHDNRCKALQRLRASVVQLQAGNGSHRIAA